MTNEQQAAYVQCMAVSAMIEMESMKAANTMREMQGFTIAYDEQAFLNLITKYGIHHNQVMSFFGD